MSILFLAKNVFKLLEKIQANFFGLLVFSLL